ncbi:hypothetical protein F5Y17DRAFT_456917 [Xylariaceae sp. FL0594]|nr:hypothetical protein F5Y17DRAFT_456917 [Xylariaceae sp. FL0594]
MPASLTPYQEATLHENRGPSIIAVCALFIVLTTIAVSLRFASRVTRKARFGADDWLSVFALIFVIGFIVTGILSVQRGQGRHVWAVDPSGAWRIVQGQIGYINALINPIARGSIKLPLLFLYRRVFTMNVKWFRYSWWILLSFIIGQSTAGFFGAAFQWYHASLVLWRRLDKSLNPPARGFCGVNTAALVVSVSALTIVVEVALFIVPILMLSQLQLKRSQKIGLMVVFGSGALAIGAESTRLHYAMTADQLGADTTWITADIFLWAAIEDSVALICACMPTLGPIIVTTKQAVSAYASEMSLWRGSGSLPRTSSDEPYAPWVTSSGTVHGNAAHANASAASLRPRASSSQCGILRTDEYSVDKHPRTDDIKLNNYHDTTNPMVNGLVV